MKPLLLDVSIQGRKAHQCRQPKAASVASPHSTPRSIRNKHTTQGRVWEQRTWLNYNRRLPIAEEATTSSGKSRGEEDGRRRAIEPGTNTTAALHQAAAAASRSTMSKKGHRFGRSSSSGSLCQPRALAACPGPHSGARARVERQRGRGRPVGRALLVSAPVVRGNERRPAVRTGTGTGTGRDWGWEWRLWDVRL